MEPNKIVLASNNSGKLVELNQLLGDLSLTLVPQGELGIEEIEETGLTFIENAIIKARHACQQSGLAAISDDSGLEVDALQGEPGVYSARYAGEPSNAQNNLQKVVQKLKALNLKRSTARFHCVIAYMKNASDPAPVICHGIWEGEVVDTPQGHEGFGYDPIFWVRQQHCTVAQLNETIKNQLSHRGKAIEKLKQTLKD